MATAVSPQAAFQFRCLGPVSLKGPDGRDLGLRTRKLIALLLVLAKGGKPVSRDALIELLWSEDSEKKARHSLSQSVSLLNKTLGAEVIAGADRDRLVLRPDHVWLDVTDFERLSGAGEHAEARGLWRGTLLEGVWIQRAPNFERWLAEERQRLERVLRRMVHDLIEERRAEGDYGAMRAEAESLLELDGLDEKAMQACLEALQLGGDRTLALRRYGEFEKRLKEELDAEPGSALRGWARRNRKGDSGAGLRYVPIPRVSEVTVLPSPQPIFGRTEEYAVLWNAWEQTTAGKGAFIVLEGEAGIGKTALASKLANQVHVAGGSVCFVRCYRTEKSVPFAPITSLMRQLSRLPGFVGLDPVWIGELTRLVPELRERYPNAPQPMAVDDAARHRLADATVQAAQAVAEEQALLVVVDDLQDADEATLAALHYLGRQTPHASLLEVVVRRQGEEPTDMERAFLETARSGGFGRFIQLRELEPLDIAKLALQVLARKGAAVDAADVSGVVAHARGNPLHAIEAALSAASDANRTIPASRASLPRPQDFDELAGERFGRTSPAARYVARTIAAAGRPLSDYELAEATAFSPASLAAAVRELEDRRFLGRSGSGLGLTHERYAGVAEEGASPTEIQAIHVRLARLLSRSAARNPAARFEVARHFELGNKPSLARAQSLAAAGFAASVGAVRERAAALELAIRVTLRPNDRLTADLGDCYLTMNELDRLAELSARAAEGHRRMPDDLRYFRIAGDYQSGKITLRDTELALTELLESCDTEFQHKATTQILLMRTADKTGNYELVRRTARAMRRELRGAPLNSYALIAAAYVFLKYYWPRRAIPLLERAIATAQQEKNWAIEQLSRDGLGIVLKQVGRYRESISQFDYSLALARKILSPQAEANALQNRAVSEQALGDFDRARATMDAADKLNALFPRWAYTIYNCYNRAMIDLYSDSPQRAIEGFTQTLQRAVEAGHHELHIDALACLGLASVRIGDPDGLARYTRGLKELVPESRLMTPSWACAAAIAWRTALLDGSPEIAVRSLEKNARELARRDTAHSLSLELERVYLLEHLAGHRNEDARARVRALARNFEAKAVEAGAA